MLACKLGQASLISGKSDGIPWNMGLNQSYMKWFHCIRYADMYSCQMWLHTYNIVYVLPCVVVEIV